MGWRFKLMPLKSLIQGQFTNSLIQGQFTCLLLGPGHGSKFLHVPSGTEGHVIQTGQSVTWLAIHG